MKPSQLLIGISVAIAGLVGYNLIHLPQQEQVDLIQAQRAEEQASQQMQADVALLLQQVEQYRARLPQEPDTALLVRDVVKHAERVGVTLKTITQESPREFVQFTRLTAQLEGSASYHELGAFVDALERSDLFIRVGMFEASRSRLDPPSTILSP